MENFEETALRLARLKAARLQKEKKDKERRESEELALKEARVEHWRRLSQIEDEVPRRAHQAHTPYPPPCLNLHTCSLIPPILLKRPPPRTGTLVPPTLREPCPVPQKGPGTQLHSCRHDKNTNHPFATTLP